MPKYNDDPDDLAEQIAKKIGGSKGAIGDITITTALDGAASLEVSLIDPDLAIVEGGKLTPQDRRVKTTDADILEAQREAGHGPYSLPHINVNYPTGSKWWWRLTDVSIDSPSDGPNVTLTFETLLVALLRGRHGPPVKKMSRAHGTRAKFIKMITTDEIKRGTKFISPELNDRQPILEPEG